MATYNVIPTDPRTDNVLIVGVGPKFPPYLAILVILQSKLGPTVVSDSGEVVPRLGSVKIVLTESVL